MIDIVKNARLGA